VAENRESCLTCLCAVATFGVLYRDITPVSSGGTGPQYFAKVAHPSIWPWLIRPWLRYLLTAWPKTQQKSI